MLPDLDSSIAVLVAIGSLLTAFGTYAATRTKARADFVALLRAELEAALVRIQNAESRIDALEAEKISLRKRVDELEDEKEALSDRFEHLQKEDVALRARLDELEAENKRLERRVGELESENKALREGKGS